MPRTTAAAKEPPAAKRKPPTPRPTVSVRPVLPDSPTHDQLAEAVNALRVWFAEVKTATRKEALMVMRVKGSCETAQRFLRDIGLPELSDRYPNWAEESAKKILPGPPVVASHYTEEGLLFLWEDLTTEVDRWLARARSRALREDEVYGRVTRQRLSTWLVHIRQPAFRKVHHVEFQVPRFRWNLDDKPSATLEAEFKTILREFAAAHGAVAEELMVETHLTTGESIA